MSGAPDIEVLAQLATMGSDCRARAIAHIALKYGPELRALLEPSRRAITFDDWSRTATIGKRVCLLPPIGYELLKVLASQPGRCFSADDLRESVWHSGYLGARTVHAHIIRLRRLIESDPQHPSLIENVRGVGWRLVL